MQSVIHNKSYYYNLPILQDIEYLYALTSNKNNDTSILIKPTVNNALKPLLNLFNTYGYYYDVNYSDRQYSKIDISNFNKHNMIVCFSGGKDSLATAIHYKKLGYNVYLYHVTGLNKHYTKEYESAKILAEKLEMPLIIEDISYKGQHDWIEHPLKNIVLVGMALNYGLKNKIGYKIAVGNYYTSTLDNITDIEFGIDAGDCIDVWKIYENIIKKFIHNFHIYVALQKMQTSYNIIVNYDYKLFFDTQSCLTPNRFRTLFHNRTQKNYTIDLKSNRCGCCWKCAFEYIWLVDKKYLPVNKKYYKHCLEVLQNTLKKEEDTFYTLEESYQRYFGYSIRMEV